MRIHRIVAATLVGHFVAAFAALGLPPFYDRILRESLHSDAIYLAGWLFAMPTLLAALSSPWWGALADRFGKKHLLLRAHIGLALSFLATSFASNAWQFGIALALQGILGGTFAASNAYLATVVSGHRLTRLLTLMQGSARAALFVGPALIGWLGQEAQPLLLYRYLALLPLLSAVLVWGLPSGEARVDEPHPSDVAPCAQADADESVSAGQVYALQLAFIFATVVTFPYFVPYAEKAVSGVASTLSGALFGLPHLVYLLVALPLSRHIGKRHLFITLAASQAVLAIALLGQGWSSGLASLVIWRIVMGAAMTSAYIALHGLVATITHAGNAGRRFGSLEASTKWGAVAAGLVAGVAVARHGLQSPFVIGAGALVLANIQIAFLLLRPTRSVLEQPARTTD